MWFVARRRRHCVDGNGCALCVIAPSFGDIFHVNGFRNRLLAAELLESVIEKLAAQSRDGDFIVDLTQQAIIAPSREVTTFSIDPLQRDALLEGLDEIALALKIHRRDRRMAEGRSHESSLGLASWQGCRLARIYGLCLQQLVSDLPYNSDRFAAG